jgi:hypothetical protein
MAKQEEVAKDILKFVFTKYPFHTSEAKVLATWGRLLYCPSEGRRAADFYRP